MNSPFEYELPEDRIAQTPLQDRGASKLLAVDRKSASIEHLKFEDCVGFFRPGDVLVLNDTRVTALRLFGTRDSGGKAELLLLKEKTPGVFEALAKPAKRLRVGSKISFENKLACTVLSSAQDGIVELDFSESLQLDQKLAESGTVPLPPYIHVALADSERYQTVYSASGGSAAAPTAGLHFTQQLLNQIERLGVELARVSLDVSLDTFRPIQSESIDQHKMHGETCRISAVAAETINAAKGRIIAVGTTTVRTLESFAVSKKKVQHGEMVSSLFIRPGYDFQVVDAMFTNFHMPRTTMLWMLAAFAGADRIQEAYQAALKENYRFLSFGDSMLIF